MATYHSTRSHEAPLTSKEAIRRGIAPDGGLYVSDELGCTQIPLAGLSEMGYLDLAREVLAALLTDYAPEEIAACVSEAYEETFADAEITPVRCLAPANADGVPTHVLELWHGPTSAFKDVALQMLPRLMARTGSNDGTGDEKIMIVTATSGDTGKAALAGFADAPGVGISVFYPEGKVSRVQELQMSTQEGANVAVCGVRGDFDNAQTAVKQDLRRSRARRAPRHPGRHALQRQFHQRRPPRAPGRVLLRRIRAAPSLRRYLMRRRGRVLRADRQLRRHPRRLLRQAPRSSRGTPHRGERREQRAVRLSHHGYVRPQAPLLHHDLAVHGHPRFLKPRAHALLPVRRRRRTRLPTHGPAGR